jgi:hypothetical protein
MGGGGMASTESPPAHGSRLRSSLVVAALALFPCGFSRGGGRGGGRGRSLLRPLGTLILHRQPLIRRHRNTVQHGKPVGGKQEHSGEHHAAATAGDERSSGGSGGRSGMRDSSGMSGMSGMRDSSGSSGCVPWQH